MTTTPPPPPETLCREPRCDKCGRTLVPEHVHRYGPFVRHYGLRCPACGWVKPKPGSKP